MSLNVGNDINTDTKEFKGMTNEGYTSKRKEVEEMSSLDKTMEAAKKRIFEDIDIEMLFPTQLKSYYASAEF